MHDGIEIAGEFFTDSHIEKWIKSDEKNSRASRIRRTIKLLNIMPNPPQGFMLHDGETSAYLLNEVRLAYCNGLYISVVLVALAFVEKQLAAALHTLGDNEAARLPLEKLCKIAVEKSVIADQLHQRIYKLRQLRNALAHFREPGHAQGVARRMVADGVYAEDVFEADADEALKVVSDFILHRFF